MMDGIKSCLLIALCIAVSGCSDAGNTKEGGEAEHTKQFEPPQSPWAPESGIVFVGVQLIDQRTLDRPPADRRDLCKWDVHTTFKNIPIRWTPNGVEQGKPFLLEARSYPHWHPPHAPLAVDGGELFVADGKVIQHRRPFSDTGVLSIGKVNRRPTALSTRNGIVYAGSAGQVTSVDFNNKGRLHALYTDEKMDPLGPVAKPVDFFVRINSRLVAIDNVVVPKFAFVFEREVSGEMRFRYRDKLPKAAPNEQITHGAVLDDTMFLIARYSHRGGSGKRLFRCKVGPSGITNTTVLSIHDDGHWSGIVAVGDRLLLGDGKDGIVVLDPNAPDERRCVSVTGACAGIIAIGKTVLALVHNSDPSATKGRRWRSTIVAYRWVAEKRTLEFIRKDPLKYPLRRIAR